MTKQEIIEDIANHKVVEKMVVNIAHRPMGADLEDLTQMVYLALLEYDEDSVVEMWDSGQFRFFIARIILNNYRSNYSPFFRCIRKYQKKAEELGAVDVVDEESNAVLGILAEGMTESRKGTVCHGGLEELACEFKDIRKEYAYNDTIFSLDSAEMRSLKYIIEHDLDVVDRAIIILYADCQSLRTLGKQLGVSHATIRNRVNRIKKTIVDKMLEI